MDKLPVHMQLEILSLVNQAEVKEGKAATSIMDPSKLLPPVRFFKDPHYTPLFEADQLKFFSQKLFRELEDPGYFIFDGFLGAKTAEDCYNQANELYTQGALRPATMYTEGTQNKYQDAKLRGDHILWVSNSSKFENSHRALFLLLQQLDALRVELNNAKALLPECDHTQIQLTCYPGSETRYVRHLDAHEGGAKRRLTCLYYMNPNWKEENGGHLRIYLPNNKDLKFVDVEPRQDRLLVFQSRVLEHEVLPTKEKRFATTMWFY